MVTLDFQDLDKVLNTIKDFQIEGFNYYFRVYWNGNEGVNTEGSWYVDILRNPTLEEQDEGGLSTEGYKYILAGLKVMPNAPLPTYRYSHENNNLFDGEVWCFDTDNTQEGDYPSLTNFGTNKRFTLVYMTKDEMEESGIKLRNN